MFRSERLIELRNIWFSTKSILVDRILNCVGVKFFEVVGGLTPYFYFEIFE